MKTMTFPVFLLILLILATVLLAGGCTTTVAVTKYKLPDPPTAFLVAPQPIKKITPGADGNTDPKDALSVIVSNNLAEQANVKELIGLQDWIRQTQNNLKKDGKP